MSAGVERVREVFERISAEVGEYIVGREKLLERLYEALLIGGHVLIEGVPGTAKTYLARAFAGTLGLNFRRVQLTPDLLPSDIVGVMVFNQRTLDFEFRPGPVFTNILLADEINRTPPRTQAALLEAMQEGQVTVAGVTRKLPEPFMVIATENPVESEGVYPLPEAEVDRFLFRVLATYPSEEEEVEVLRKKLVHGESIEVREVIGAAEVMELRRIVHGVRAEEPVLRYIVRLVRETRENSSILLGGSTRAAVHVLYAARARAAVAEGRDYVIPDDVRDVFFDVMNHRIILRPEVIVGSYSREPLWTYKTVMRVLRSVVEAVPVPR